LVLIWPLAEAGLAVATSITAAGQVVWLLLLVPKHLGPLPWRSLIRTLCISLLATLLMSIACIFTLAGLTVGKYSSPLSALSTDTLSRLNFVAWPMLAAGVTYLLAIYALPGRK